MTFGEWRNFCKKEAKAYHLEPSAAIQAIDQLLMAICHLSVEALYLFADRTLSDEELKKLRALWVRFLAGEPLAYLTQTTDFWTQTLTITPHVLIPRCDSETLVEAVLSCIRGKFTHDFNTRVLELGVGSGALSLAIASECPAIRLFGIERSHEALKIAEKNRQRNQIKNVTFFWADWWDIDNEEILKPNEGQCYDIVFSNPPYVCDRDQKWRQSSLRYEPEEALFSGESGLKDIRHIVWRTRDILKESGWLFIEHGSDQRQQVQHHFNQQGYIEMQTVNDLNGHPRVTMGKKCLRLESLVKSPLS